MKEVSSGRVDLSTMISEMRAALRFGVLLDVTFEDRGTVGVENHDSKSMSRVFHRCSSNGAIEDLSKEGEQISFWKGKKKKNTKKDVQLDLIDRKRR